jgi:hypothetical protein
MRYVARVAGGPRGPRGARLVGVRPGVVAAPASRRGRFIAMALSLLSIRAAPVPPGCGVRAARSQ